MREIDRIIRRARIRMTLADFVRRAGWWLVIGVGVSAFFLMVDRFTAFTLPPVVLVVAPVIALLASSVMAWRHRPRNIEAAARLDHELGLKDRIGSAAALDESITWEEPFADAVRHDAEATASLAQTRLKQATRIHWPNSWVGAVSLAIVTAAAWWLVPEIDLFPQRRFNAQEQIRIAQAETQAEAALREAAEALRQKVEDDADPISADAIDDDESTGEVLKTLDRLADQLAAARHDDNTSAPGRADEALAEAADELSSLAESLDRRAEAAEEANRELADELSKIEPLETGAADDLAEALREADFARAAEEARNLNDRMSELSTEEREALARQLRDLSEQIESAPAQNQQEREDERHLDQETLTEQGVDPEEAERLAEEGFTPENVVEALEDAGVDERTARDLADELNKNEQQREEEEKRDDRLEETAKDLDDLARTVDSNEPTAPKNQDSDDPGDPQAEDDSTDPGETPKEQPETGRDTPGTEPKEGDEPTSDSPGKQPEPTANEGETQTDPPGEGTTPTPESDAPPQTEGEPLDGPPQNGVEESPDSPANPNSPIQNQPGADKESTPGSPPNSPPGSPPDKPRTAKEIIDHLERHLDEIENERDRISKDRDEAERLRNEAEKLLDQLSPEEREELERWANEYAREKAREKQGEGPLGEGEGFDGDEKGPRFESNNRPYEIEDIETERPKNEPQDDQVLAEWFRDEAHGRDNRIGRDLLPRERTRRAAEAMERALNDEAIAPRYRTLIRNWARRMREQQSAPSSTENAPSNGSASDSDTDG